MSPLCNVKDGQVYGLWGGFCLPSTLCRQTLAAYRGNVASRDRKPTFAGSPLKSGQLVPFAKPILIQQHRMLWVFVMESSTLRKLVRTLTRYRTRFAAATVASGLVFVALASVAQCATRLLPQEQLQQLGLTRAWFSQVKLDHARNQIERAVLQGDRLTVLTSAGVVEEFNALTGESLWIAPIGNQNFPSLGPACSDRHVAVVNGSTLYVLDRTDGRPAIIRRVGGAPGAAPAISAKYVFVALASGRIEAYSLADQKKLTPWYYQSDGRAMVAPLATPESVIWTTETGFLYVGDCIAPKMRFRLETGSEIVASPSYKKPLVYVSATSGEVFAMQEMTGHRQWKFATGFPVSRTPAPVGDRVFVTSDEPALHCIDDKSGASVWQTPRIAQFAAASKHRVYGVDDLGALVVLDIAKGSALGRITTGEAVSSLVNDQTDRVYLVSKEGAIECLREIDAIEPLYHNPKPAEKPTTEADAKQPAEKPAAPAKPQPKPAAPAPDSTEEKEEQPSNAKPAEPASPPKPPVDDNPFG